MDLLDTHVVLRWFGDRTRLSPRQVQVLEQASPDRPLLVSEITLWEVAMLVERGRIQVHLPLREFLMDLSAAPLVRRVGITPAIAAEVAALPGWFHRDPADRILVATARVLGARLLTSDDLILRSKLVATLD